MVGTWKLYGGDSIRLIAPDGSAVPLVTQKVGLVALVLARAGGEHVSRDDLAMIGWPDKPGPQAKVNLRQALKHLRRAVSDEHALQIGLDHCAAPTEYWWLDPTALSVPLPQARARTFSAVPNSRSTLLVRPEMDALISLARFTFDADPVKVVDVLRAVPILSEDFELGKLHGMLETIVKTMSPSAPEAGWAHYFMGLAAAYSGSAADAQAHFSLAGEYGDRGDDPVLMLRSDYHASLNALVMGSRDELLQSMRRGVAAAYRNPDLPESARMIHARATAHIHLGKTDQGLREYNELQSVPTGRLAEIDWAIFRSHEALFLATAGKPRSAARILEELAPCITRLQHTRLRLTCEYVQAEILRAQCQNDQAEVAFASVFRQSDELDSFAMEIYSLEGLAVIAKRRGDNESSRRFLSEADALRRRAGMALTYWDRERRAELFNGGPIG